MTAPSTRLLEVRLILTLLEPPNLDLGQAVLELEIFIATGTGLQIWKNHFS